MHLHIPRTMRSPLSFQGNRVIIPFQPFFHAFFFRSGKSNNEQDSLVCPSYVKFFLFFLFRTDHEIVFDHLRQDLKDEEARNKKRSKLVRGDQLDRRKERRDELLVMETLLEIKSDVLQILLFSIFTNSTIFQFVLQ